ncbi:hypothetical protein FKM82_023204 [Ascaphus truei]
MSLYGLIPRLYLVPLCVSVAPGRPASQLENVASDGVHQTWHGLIWSGLMCPTLLLGEHLLSCLNSAAFETRFSAASLCTH